MSFLTGVDLAWSWGRGRLTQGGIPTVVTSLFGSITSLLDTGHSSWLVETKAIPVRCHMEVVVRPVGARVYTHREGQRGWRGGWRGNGRGCWWKCGRGVGWCLFFKRVKPECVRVYTQRDATPGFSYSSLQCQQLNGLSANHTQLLRNTCKVNVYILKCLRAVLKLICFIWTKQDVLHRWHILTEGSLILELSFCPFYPFPILFILSFCPTHFRIWRGRKFKCPNNADGHKQCELAQNSANIERQQPKMGRHAITRMEHCPLTKGWV